MDWACKRLSGTLPKEIGSLNCLTRFSVYNNSIRGPIPFTMSNLTKLTELYLNANLLDGKIPMSLSHLSNLQNLGLQSNNFEAGQDIPQAYLSDINQCKTYLNSLRRRPALRLLNYGMKITAKRIESDNPATVSPIFAFMVNNSDLYDVIVSYLDPLHVCTESRNRLLRIWMGMGGDEDNLRRGYDPSIRGSKGKGFKNREVRTHLLLPCVPPLLRNQPRVLPVVPIYRPLCPLGVLHLRSLGEPEVAVVAVRRVRHYGHAGRSPARTYPNSRAHIVEHLVGGCEEGEEEESQELHGARGLVAVEGEGGGGDLEGSGADGRGEDGGIPRGRRLPEPSKRARAVRDRGRRTGVGCIDRFRGRASLVSLVARDGKVETLMK